MTAPVLDLGARQPFKQFALEYLTRGWLPLPLPPGEKAPPPKKSTGHYPNPTEEDVERWIASEEDRSNIGLRMPDGIIGIDVDAYAGKQGGQTLSVLTERWGNLPPTWTLTARADGLSGIRFFRIPEGLRWPGDLGADIEVIQHKHRYAVCFPSKHPKLKKIYRWYAPGKPTDGKSFSDEIPDLLIGSADTMPFLPEGWLEGISAQDYIERERVDVGSMKEFWRWVRKLPDSKGEPCKQMARALTSGLENLEESASGAAHSELNDRSHEIMCLGVEGHRGAWTALSALGKAFIGEVAERRQSATLAGAPAGTVRSEGDAKREIDREYLGASRFIMLADVCMACSCWDEPVIGQDEDGNAIHAESGRAGDPAQYEDGDIGNTQHLVDLADGSMLWVSDYSEWFSYNETLGLWEESPASLGMQMARRIAPRVEAAIESKRIALAATNKNEEKPGGQDNEHTAIERQLKRLYEVKKRVSSSAGLSAMVDLAKSWPEMVARADEFDMNERILLCSDGQVIELLEDGYNARPATREDRLTRHTSAPYVPGASDPGWTSYLDTFLPDPELRRYVQRLFGYALLGSNPRRKLVFLHGPSSTGKSTLVEAVGAALGSYADTFSMSLFRGKQDDAPRPDIVKALPMRAIFASEAGSAWYLHNDEIKSMVGGDTKQARLMRGNHYFSRVPAFLPIIATNEFPQIQGADAASWRRMVAVPFDTVVAGRDDDADGRDALRTSPSAWSAILAWLLEGWNAYCELGLDGDGVPEAVVHRTARMRGEVSDTHAWLFGNCELGPKFVTVFDELFQNYDIWARTSGLEGRDIMSKIKLGKFLTGQECTVDRGRVDGKTCVIRVGIRLRTGSAEGS